jgi:tetratricopeptide (TPR) repeat protein
MFARISLWAGLIGVAATIPLVQTVAYAKSPVEIAATAKTITVLITEANNVGSGVILQQQGDIYTVITAAHVVKNKVSYKITTSDDRSYEVISSSIRRAPGSIDLAVIKFKSTAKYPTAKLGNCNVLKSGMDLYVAGFPGTSAAITESILVVREGRVSANSNKTFENGYSLVYSNDTLPGMSGGAVLNSDGELVAIHGRGDREQLGDGKFGAKNGFNLGIPVNRFATVASNMGIELSGQVAPIPTDAAPKADDYLVSAAQKAEKSDHPGALADYSQAIAINPKYAEAYNNRGHIKFLNLNDSQGALADFNQAIAINPRYAIAYINRSGVKFFNLNDPQGALVDLNQAIAINPKDATAYQNRGGLKFMKLNDPQGALVDLNQAIAIDPRYASAYNSRGTLKFIKLNDVQGALADFNQAITLDPKNANAYKSRGELKYIKLNDVQGALADLNKTITLDPKNANAYSNRGVIKSQNLNDIQGGLADFTKAIEIKPGESNGYYDRGDLLYSSGNISAAIIDFQKVAAIDKNGVQGLTAQGVMQIQQGDYARAISLFNKANQIKSEYGDTYKYRGIAYKNQGKKAAAIQDWQKAAQIYKKHTQIRDYKILLGWLKELGAGE